MLLVVWEEEGVSKVPRCDKQPAQIIFFSYFPSVLWEKQLQ